MINLSQPRKNLGAWFLMACICLATWPLSADLLCRNLNRALLEPVRISNEYVRENNFNVSRDLKAYGIHFRFPHRKSFVEELEALPENAVWFDMGAGEGRALFQGLRQFSHIKKGIALSYRKAQFSVSEEEMPGRLLFYHGDLVENMWRKGRLDSHRGQVNLITDLYGPLSYSRDIAKVLQIYFDLLAPGGKLMFNIMESRNHSGSGAGGKVLDSLLFMNPVFTAEGGRSRGIIEWLVSIDGVRLSAVSESTARQQSRAENSISLTLVKTAENVIVPGNLSTQSYNASNPPQRSFWWEVN